MDDGYLPAAAYDRERNPVRAGLTATAGGCRGSSLAAHLGGRDDGLAKVAPLLSIAGDWRAFLGQPTSEDVRSRLPRYEHTGRPSGS